MSNLFIKFLPVEGEIKEGDTYTKSGDPTVHTSKMTYMTDSVGVKTPLLDHTLWSMTLQKTLPHLCSRDIQVGDKVWGSTTDGSGYKEHYITSDQREVDLAIASGDFKSLGIISPDATWVYDGMEVREEDVRMVMEGLEKTLLPWNHFLPKPLSATFKLRCPSSPNHFH